MIIKTMGENRPFQKKLNFRLVLAVSMFVLGGLALAVSLTLLPGSGLPDFVRGFYGGICGGLIGGGLAVGIRVLWLRTHPCAAKKAEIKETDERERAIAKTAMQTTFGIAYFALAAALLVAAPLSLTVFFTLLGVFFFHLFVFCAALAVCRLRM